MNTPNPDLMRAYGTNDVFEKKAENVLPLAARLAVGLLNYKMTQRELEQAKMQQLEAQALHALMAQADKERFREMEALAAERGIVLHEAGLEALDRLWEEVK